MPFTLAERFPLFPCKTQEIHLFNRLPVDRYIDGVILPTNASNNISVRHNLYYAWSKKTTTAIAMRGGEIKDFMSWRWVSLCVLQRCSFLRLWIDRTWYRWTVRKKGPQWLIIYVFWLGTVGCIPMLSWRESLTVSDNEDIEPLELRRN